MPSSRRRPRSVRIPAVLALLGLTAWTATAAEVVPAPAVEDPHAAHHHHHAAPPQPRRGEAVYELPDVTLVDQDGERTPLGTLLGADRPVMVNFIYTTCTAICPVMSATFAQVQRELGADAGRVTMVSFSIDPDQDTPAALAEYAQRFAAGPQWRFLTGSVEDSIAVQKAFLAYRGDKMNHTPLTLLRPRPGEVWVRYDGFATAAELAADARAMIGE